MLFFLFCLGAVAAEAGASAVSSRPTSTLLGRKEREAQGLASAVACRKGRNFLLPFLGGKDRQTQGVACVTALS